MNLKKSLTIFIVILMTTNWLFADLVTKESIISIKTNLEGYISTFKAEDDFNDYTISAEKIYSIKDNGNIVGWFIELSPQGFILVPGVTEAGFMEMISFKSKSENNVDIIPWQVVDGQITDDFLNQPIVNSLTRNFTLIMAKLNYIDAVAIPSWVAPIINNIQLNTATLADINLSWASMGINIINMPIVPFALSEKMKEDFEQIHISKFQPYNNWSQATYFNDLFPDNNIVGCTAVATAQLLKYWQYPAAFNGNHLDVKDHRLFAPYEHSDCSDHLYLDSDPLNDINNGYYDWGQLPNRLYSLGISRAVEQCEVERLLYEAAAAVDMNLGYWESGAHICSVASTLPNPENGTTGTPSEHGAQGALKNHFGYNTHIACSSQKTLRDLSKKEIRRIINNFKHKIPVIIGINVNSGYEAWDTDETDGHAVIASGFNQGIYSHEDDYGIHYVPIRAIFINLGWGSNSEVWMDLLHRTTFTASSLSTGVTELLLNAYPQSWCYDSNPETFTIPNNEHHQYLAPKLGCPHDLDNDSADSVNGIADDIEDNCPNVYNPFQYAKYWCPDNDRDGYCDSLEWKDIIRLDCVPDEMKHNNTTNEEEYSYKTYIYTKNQFYRLYVSFDYLKGFDMLPDKVSGTNIVLDSPDFIQKCFVEPLKVDGDPSCTNGAYYTDPDPQFNLIKDNCIGVPNPKQEDDNYNGIGDACETCAGDPNQNDPINRWVPAPMSSKIFGVYRKSSTFDAIDVTKGYKTGILGDYGLRKTLLIEDNSTLTYDDKGNRNYYSFYRELSDYDISYMKEHNRELPQGLKLLWKPDNDLDGYPDVCDPDTIYLTAAAQASSTGNGSHTSGGVTYLSSIVGEAVEVSVTVSDTNSQPKDKAIQVRYCGTRYESEAKLHWGEAGYCTVSSTDWHYNPAKYNDKPTDYGYSHGSDPKISDVTKWQIWKPATYATSILDANNLITHYLFNNNYGTAPANEPLNDNIPGNKTYYWNWRAELCRAENSLCGSLNTIGSGINYYYTVSVGLGPKNAINTQYKSPFQVNSEDVVNPDFFINKSIYARAFRTNTDYQTVSFKDQTIPIGINIKYLDPFPYHRPIDLGLSELGEEVLHEGLRRSTRFDERGYLVVADKTLPRNAEFAFHRGDGIMYSIGWEADSVTTGIKNYKLYIGTDQDVDDWGTKGVVANMPQGYSLKTAVYNQGKLYIAMGTAQESELGVVSLSDQSLQYNKISDLRTTDVQKLAVVNNRMVIFTNFSDELQLYTIGLSGESLTHVEFSQPLPARAMFGATVEGSKIYMAGGFDKASTKMQDVVEINLTDTAPAWRSLAANISGNLVFPVLDVKDNSVRIAKPQEVATKSAEIVMVTKDTGLVTKLNLPVEGNTFNRSFEVKYCLSETATQLKGGLVQDANCVPFNEKNKKSIDTGSTIYTVAGSGNRLYAGTNSAIKVYDITDPLNPVLKQTLTLSKRVYDLEIDDTTMYAATTGGIYKINIAADPISVITSKTVSGNYQYKSLVYNGKLYVADDRGIAIRNKDTLAQERLYYTYGYAVDMAIIGNKLLIYWFDVFGDGMELLNADTLQVESDASGSCSSMEITADHNRFYFNCDGYAYRVEQNGSNLDFYSMNGDMLELQDNHYYNNYVYWQSGKYLKISTLNPASAVCGNGIVEVGEVCEDGAKACTALGEGWSSGTAYCNSTCKGYNTDSCESSAW